MEPCGACAEHAVGSGLMSIDFEQSFAPLRSFSIVVLCGVAATAGCEVSTDEVAFFRLGGAEVGGDFGGIWNTDVGERKRIIAIDVDGRTVTVVVGSPYEDVEQFWSLSGPSLQTLRFTSD